jgi:hypothetical protein
MKLVGVIIVSLFFGSCFAQGNLQFNQVKLVTVQETIPAGKVWKITGILPSYGYRYTSGGTSPYEYGILVNGNQRIIGHGSYLNTSYNSPFSAQSFGGDLWLPAGTNLAVGSNVGEISVIEFNIVP